jgi:hypothetical protein
MKGDDKPDVVVVNTSAGTVQVLLGNGDGTLFSMSSTSTGSSPPSVAVEDLNHDGKPDLVVANRSSDTVSVLLGNGDGSFGAKCDYDTGSCPNSVTIGDLNADNRADLIVPNSCEWGVSVLLGNGDGTFEARADQETGEDPTSVAVGDVNGDGSIDIAVAHFSPGVVSVLFGNGDGTSYALKHDYGASRTLTGLAIDDLDGDSRPDVVTSCAWVHKVSVLRNTSGDVVAVPPEATRRAYRLSVLQPYPNPSTAGAVIRFALPDPRWVDVDVFDVSGRKVRTLLTRTIHEARRETAEMPADTRSAQPGRRRHTHAVCRGGRASATQ